MNSDNCSPLLSFCLLKTFSTDNNKISIDIFIPFVAKILIENYKTNTIPKDQYSQKIKDEIKKKYKLNFPIDIITELFNRLKKKSLIKFRKIEIEIDKEKCRQESNKIDDIHNFKNDIEKFVNKFQCFYEEKTGKRIENEKVQSTFLSFLEKNSYEILCANKKNQKLISKIEGIKIRNQDKYLFAKFILNLYEENQSDDLEILFKINFGNIIANLTLVEKKDTYQTKLSNLNIYIDTPILLRILGIDGEEFEKATKEFLDILRDQKVQISIFDHSYDETCEVLNSSKHWIDNPQYDPRKASKCTRFIIENEKTQVDIDLYLSQLEQVKKKYNMKIDSNNYYDNPEYNRYQIDENSIQEKIENYYNNDITANLRSTIAKDVKSIAYIYKLRKEKRYFSLKNAKYIFVTSNNSLANASRKYEQDKKYQIPVCLTSSFLCMVVWQEMPNDLIQNLTKSDFISYCYSALQPSEELIEKFIKEAKILVSEREITEENYQAVKRSAYFHNILSSDTFNDTDNYNNETFKESNEKFKKELQEEYKKKEQQQQNEIKKLQYQKEYNVDKRISIKKKIKKDYKSHFYRSWIFIKIPLRNIRLKSLKLGIKIIPSLHLDFEYSHSKNKSKKICRQYKILFYKKKLKEQIPPYQEWLKKENSDK